MAFYDALLVFGLLLFLGVGFVYLRHPAASFWHPLTIYLALHGIVFAFRPILARIFDYQLLYTSTRFQPSLGDKITVLLAADLALIVFVAVSLRVASRPVDLEIGGTWQWRREKLWVPFLAVSAIIAPIAVYAAADEWLATASNASTMVIDTATGVNFNTTGNGWFSTSQLALVPIVTVFAWLTRFRWYSLIPFGLFFLLRAGTGGRGPIIIAAVAIVILFLLERGRKWPEWRASVLILAMALAFNAIVTDRGKAVREAFIADEAYVSSGTQEAKPFEHMDFANLEYFEFAVYAIPQRSGTYDYFLHNLQIFTEPIPRIWWKDKPLGPPIAMYQLPDYGRPYGFTYSVPGVGWMSWGWPGVVIQSALFALLFGALHRRMAAGPQTPVYVLVFALMIASTVVSYRDGTFLTVVRVLPFYIGPIAAMWLLSIPLTRQFGRRSSFPAERREARAGFSSLPAQRRKALAGLVDASN